MSQITDNIENSSNDENENSDKNTNPITSITIFEDLEYYMPDDLAKTLDSHGYTPCHFQGIFPRWAIQDGDISFQFILCQNSNNKEFICLVDFDNETFIKAYENDHGEDKDKPRFYIDSTYKQYDIQIYHFNVLFFNYFKLKYRLSISQTSN